jgi:predicted dehydrogenase
VSREPLRVGVVGLGVISRFYLAALRRSPSLRLAAVCDPDERALAAVHGPVPRYRDHRDLVSRGRLDAIVVTVPNDVHVQVCRDALAAGLPVCVEKPLATRLEDGRRLAEYARSRGCCLFTAFHRRYNRAVLALASRLPRQVPVESVTVRYLERIEDHAGRDRWYLDPGRCGGGCLADNGPNAFDLARLFLGELAVTEVATGRDGGGVDRQARIALTSPAGANALVSLDWSYPGERKEVEVRLADGRRQVADMLAGYRGFKASLWHEYTGVLRAFEHAVAAGPGYRDGGLAALELVDAAYRAERPAQIPRANHTEVGLSRGQLQGSWALARPGGHDA